MKRRTLALLLSAALCIGTLTACDNNGPMESKKPSGSPPSEESTQVMEPSTKLAEPPQVEQIIADVNGYRYTVLPETAKVTGCEVIKRQSNPEQKEDIVYCRLTGPEDGYKYSQYYVRLLYNFYDEGGWILDEMTADQEDQWGVVGYLGSDGAPLEDGMVETSLPPMYNSDGIPYAVITTINNEGMWSNGNEVYDFQGNQVKGLTDTSNANRGFQEDGGLLYLCTPEGERLSGGYESIRAAGAVLDEEGNIVDHRWRVEKGGNIGFLNDEGQEVISLNYPADDNSRASFYDYETDNRTCVLYNGGTGVVVDLNGREVCRFSNDGSTKALACGNGFFIITPTHDGNYTAIVEAYTADGQRLLSERYYDVLWYNKLGFCGQRGYDALKDGWTYCDWETTDKIMCSENGLFTSFLPLNGGRFHGMHGLDWCVFRGTWLTERSTIDFYTSSAIRSSAYGAYITNSQDVLDTNGNAIISGEEYSRITAVGGGLYVVSKTDNGGDALFDWQGNQRTPFYDAIRSYSENGRYFLVYVGETTYALKSPLSEEELTSAPILDKYLVSGGVSVG